MVDTSKPDNRILLVLCLCLIMGVLNFLALTPFYPEVSSDLDVSISLLGQVVTFMILLSADSRACNRSDCRPLRLSSPADNRDLLRRYQCDRHGTGSFFSLVDGHQPHWRTRGCARFWHSVRHRGRHFRARSAETSTQLADRVDECRRDCRDPVAHPPWQRDELAGGNDCARGSGSVRGAAHVRRPSQG